MCVCVCVLFEGGRRRKMANIHHYSITTPPLYTCMYTYISTCIFSPYHFGVKLYECDKLSNKQTRIVAVEGRKEPSAERKTFTIIPVCLFCWSKCELCFFLLLRQKNGINPFSTCFLYFPKHLSCIIHTGPLANRISCLS